MAKVTDHKDSAAHVKVILYRSKTLADGSHPLMLRITKDRQRKYISLGESCQLKFWDEEKNKPRRNHPRRAELEQLIRKWETHYAEIAYELRKEEKPFTSVTVAAKAAKNIRKVSVLGFMDEVYDRLTREKRLGMAITIHNVRRALIRFEESKHSPNLKLLFTDLTVTYLDDFKVHMRELGLVDTSLAVHFRSLRYVYNQAVERGLVAEKYYPFKKFKISQFDLRTRKRAISKDDIKAIAILNPETDRLRLAQHLFLFSYYGAGINFIDLAQLTWKDVQHGRLSYRRQKTGHLFNFKLAAEAQAILDYYRARTYTRLDAYVFPILDQSRHITPTQIQNRTHKIIGQVNKDLKELAQLAGIDVVLTTYVARHSFATALKRSGVNTAIISEAMGHQTEEITQTYLASFANDLIDDALSNL